MPFRKYKIIYNAKGKVIGSQEIPITQDPPRLVQKPNRLVQKPPRLVQKPQRQPLPKAQGQNRARIVALECFKDGITDEDEIMKLLVEIYRGEKSEKYLMEARRRVFFMINEFKNNGRT